MKPFTVPFFSLCLAIGLSLSGCSMRDENGNINPAQIRQNVIDTHEKVTRAQEALNNGAEALNTGAKVVTEGVSEAVTEITAPKPPPTNVTQPDR